MLVNNKTPRYLITTADERTWNFDRGVPLQAKQILVTIISNLNLGKDGQKKMSLIIFDQGNLQ